MTVFADLFNKLPESWKVALVLSALLAAPVLSTLTIFWILNSVTHDATWQQVMESQLQMVDAAVEALVRWCRGQ